MSNSKDRPTVKTPEVVLFGVSSDPSLAMFGRTMGDGEFGSELAERLFDVVDHPIVPHPADRVRLSFLIFNASRAFQQQLTRHRLDFSYSIQSLRMVDVGSFKKDGGYTLPSTLSDYQAFGFEMCMGFVEEMYQSLIKDGAKVEDARGLLPLNIHSTITFSATYRALLGMLGQRLCFATQEENRDIAKQIKTKVTEWNKVLGSFLKCPCLISSRCFMHKEDCPYVESGRVHLQ